MVKVTQHGKEQIPSASSFSRPTSLLQVLVPVIHIYGLCYMYVGTVSS